MRFQAWITAIAIAIFSVIVFAKDTRVDGYHRKDGTYVAPHYRSAPNKSYNDNWSTAPNINPHTGKKGTQPPTLNNKPPARRR